MNPQALALATALLGYAPVTPAPAPVGTLVVRVPTLWTGAAAIVESPSGALVTENDLAAAIAGAGLVAVGEKHDSADHHRVQAEVLASLAARVPATAVGLEMVSYEDQPTLDAFASGAMSEAAFAAWWKTNWGFDYALYKPVFDEARRRNLPLYGLNAPAALVKAVSKNGLAALSPADRARLPFVIAESSDARYKQFVLDSVAGHGPLTPDQLAHRLEAMAVWNETMGEQAARRVAEGRTLFLVAGEGHVLYRAGVPESARRRGVAKTVVVLPYPFAPEAGVDVPEMLRRLRDPATGELEQADYFRLIP